MNANFTLKHFSLSLVLIFIFAVLCVTSIAYIQKIKFYDYINSKYGDKTFYKKTIFENDFNATSEQIQELEFGKATYKGNGFSMNIYEISNYESIQIISRWKNVLSINYLKKPLKEEWYYEPGYYERNDSRSFTYIPGKYKKRYVEDMYFSPHLIYQSCWEYFENNFKTIGAKKIDVDIVDELVNKFYYFKLVSTSFIGVDEEYNYYSNEYFEVPIRHCWKRYEASFVWTSIFYDIILYFLIISIVPVLLYLLFRFKENKYIICFLVFNCFALLFSVYINGPDFLKIDMCKIIWPFTKDIVVKEKKAVFLGKDPFSGLDLMDFTEETYMRSINPVAGYDFSEFLIYCGIGFALLKYKKNTN